MIPKMHRESEKAVKIFFAIGEDLFGVKVVVACVQSFRAYTDLSFHASQKLLNILNVKLVIVSGKQSCLSSARHTPGTAGFKGRM